jgi:uncharacterized membrane protein YeiB
VLLENLQHFVVPSYAAIALAPEASALDRGAFALVQLVCDNKVYAIFAFLFGHGVALQMLRAEAVGAPFVVLHLWRMAVLFLIGVAHSLVWTGDILSTYALLGMLLLPLRHRSDRSLIAVAALGFTLPTLVGAALTAWGAGLDIASLTRLQTVWPSRPIPRDRAPSPLAPSHWACWPDAAACWRHPRLRSAHCAWRSPPPCCSASPATCSPCRC